MNYAFDSYGFYAGQTDPSNNRSTTVAPPVCGNGQQPNWTGNAWVCMAYVAPPPPSLAYLPMLPFDFLNRLLQPERVQILTLAQTDMVTADFINMLDHAPTVTLNDPRLVAGVTYLSSKLPILTPARVAAILDPTK